MDNVGAAPGPSAGVREVKSAARAIEVLELLAQRGNEPVTIRELCEKMQAPRSSVYALLRTLCEAGWVRSDPARTQYAIGIRALLAGTTYLDADPLLKVVRPHLARLGRSVGATVNFGRVDGHDIVYLASWEAPGRERDTPRVGRRLPAYATALGQAVLAELPPQERDLHLPAELPALTADTITTRTGLDHALRTARQRGHAVERGQNTPGTACVAVALPAVGRTFDALSASVAAAELTPARERVLAAALHATAELASEVIAGLENTFGSL